VALKRINSDVVESKDNERINEYKGNWIWESHKIIELRRRQRRDVVVNCNVRNGLVGKGKIGNQRQQ
jgi:hypothetical protein